MFYGLFFLFWTFLLGYNCQKITDRSTCVDNYCCSWTETFPASIARCYDTGLCNGHYCYDAFNATCQGSSCCVRIEAVRFEIYDSCCDGQFSDPTPPVLRPACTSDTSPSSCWGYRACSNSYCSECKTSQSCAAFSNCSWINNSCSTKQEDSDSNTDNSGDGKGGEIFEIFGLALPGFVLYIIIGVGVLIFLLIVSCFICCCFCCCCRCCRKKNSDSNTIATSVNVPMVSINYPPQSQPQTVGGPSGCYPPPATAQQVEPTFSQQEQMQGEEDVQGEESSSTPAHQELESEEGKALQYEDNQGEEKNQE